MSSRVGRKRNAENKGLPARWRHYHGAYYYRVPAGLEAHWDGKRQFHLGSTLAEAYKTWAARFGAPTAVRTIAHLLDRYALEVVPTKALTNQPQHATWIKQLRAVFGAMPLDALEPQHIYQYVDRRSRKKTSDTGKTTGGRIAAHREVEVLRHAFTKAVEWGHVRAHPFKGEVRLEGEAPRSRYVEDWEVIECLTLGARRRAGSVLAIQAYIRLKLLTGMRRGDLLRLRMVDCREDGIHVTPHKDQAKHRQEGHLQLVARAACRGRKRQGRAATAHRAFFVLRPQRTVLPRRGDWPMSRVEVDVATVL